jgi:hypothetical protein
MHKLYVFTFLCAFLMTSQKTLAGNLPLGSDVSPEQYNEKYVDHEEATEVAVVERGSARVETEVRDPYRQYMEMSLTPMIGWQQYYGSWGQQIYNNYSFGLSLEIPLHPIFSLEVEGSYAQNKINWAGPGPISPFMGLHNFNQYSLGLNGKLYIVRSRVFNPYVGAGILASLFDGLWSIRRYGYYSQATGSGQLMAGVDINLFKNVAIGARGSLVVPVITPFVPNNGYVAAPGFEDASAISTAYFRAMGTVKVSF